MRSPRVRHCIVPAAGLGTRFVPATRVVPKELLPVLDRPVIQWGVEEAIAAGCDRIILVLGKHKAAVASHFNPDPLLEQHLRRRGQCSLLDGILDLQRRASFSYVHQPRPLGLGHAVLQAAALTAGHVVACALPDDISWGRISVLRQVLDAHAATGATVVALRKCPLEQVGRYGCAVVAESRGRLHRLTGMVEKPAPGSAPSNLAIMGRYVLTPGVMEALATTPPGAGGEIQLTDGIARAARAEPVWGLEIEGELLDIGTPQGWLSNVVRMAMADPTLRQAVREALAGTGPTLPEAAGRMTVSQAGSAV
jgi:UTP--glucose-1-phosphate uridylyltransferase